MVETNSFNSSRYDIINMSEGEKFNPASFIHKEMWKYAQEHKDEILAISDREDYEELPPLDDFNKWYFDELKPRVNRIMKEEGYTEKEVKEIVGGEFFWFYRVTLPGLEARRHITSSIKESETTA